MSDAVISTPCVKLCVVDPISSYCIGCGRTTAEIAAWSGMSETKRTTIIGVLEARLRGARSRERRGGRLSRGG